MEKEKEDRDEIANAVRVFIAVIFTCFVNVDFDKISLTLVIRVLHIYDNFLFFIKWQKACFT